MKAGTDELIDCLIDLIDWQGIVGVHCLSVLYIVLHIIAVLHKIRQSV